MANKKANQPQQSQATQPQQGQTQQEQAKPATQQSSSSGSTTQATSSQPKVAQTQANAQQAPQQQGKPAAQPQQAEARSSGSIISRAGAIVLASVLAAVLLLAGLTAIGFSYLNADRAANAASLPLQQPSTETEGGVTFTEQELEERIAEVVASKVAEMQVGQQNSANSDTDGVSVSMVPMASEASIAQEVPQAALSQQLVTSQSALNILAEVDSLQKLSREGLFHTTLRYEIISGSTASAALMATQAGTLTRVRIVCDDLCTGIYWVSGNSVVDIKDRFNIYVPQGVTTEPYVNWIPFQNVQDWDFDVMLGAANDDTLTQWVATNLNLTFRPGDHLVIHTRDDPQLQVNVGPFVGGEFIVDAPTGK